MRTQDRRPKHMIHADMFLVIMLEGKVLMRTFGSAMIRIGVMQDQKIHEAHVVLLHGAMLLIMLEQGGHMHPMVAEDQIDRHEGGQQPEV